MMTEDTIELLRECSSGVKMGINAIDDVIEKTESEKLHGLLRDSRNEHESIERDIKKMLKGAGGDTDADGVHPIVEGVHPIVEGVARLKTGIKLSGEHSDADIADILTDGCNMGVKNLHRYLNKYPSADVSARRAAERLVNIEERLCIDMRSFLK